MTAKIFTNSLLSKLAAALGRNNSLPHAALDNLWLAFNNDTSLADGNKQNKANEMVQKISKKPNADEELLTLINEAFFIDSNADWRQRDSSFSRFEEALLDAGFGVTQDGVTFPSAVNNSYASATTSFSRPPQTAQTPWPWESAETPTSGPSWGANTISTTTSKEATTSVSPIRGKRSVFIVHGRDTDNRDALQSLLKEMDIRPVTWIEAAKHAPTQDTLKIVETGMAIAQAVIVLFTPDDQARLKPQFLEPHDEPYESQPTGQARPNVLLEAGMAYAKAPDRTIFARIGNLRRISDIDGLNWINLDNNWESRVRLKNDLIKAGVELNEDAHLIADTAGKFRMDM